MEKAITDASAGGYLDPHKLWNQFYGKTGVGKDVMAETFEPQYLHELNKTLDVAKRMNMSNLSAGNPSGTGGAIVNWTEGVMMISIPANFAQNVIKTVMGKTSMAETLAQTAMDIQKMGVYALSMRDLAQLMNSKEGLRILRQGMEMPVTASNAARVTTQIFTHALDLQDRDISHQQQAVSQATPPRTQAVPQQPLP